MSTAIKPFKYQPPAAFGSSEEINGIIERMEALVPVTLTDGDRRDTALVKSLDNAYLKAAQLSAFYRLIPGIDVHLIRFGKAFVVDTGVAAWQKAADRYCAQHGITYHAYYEEMSQEELQARRADLYSPQDAGSICYIWRSDKVQVYSMFGGKDALTQGRGHWAIKAKWNKFDKVWESDQIPAQRTKQDVAKRRALKAALKAEFSLDSLLAAAPNEVREQLAWLDKDAKRTTQDQQVMQRQPVDVDEDGFVITNQQGASYRVDKEGNATPIDEAGYRMVGTPLDQDEDFDGPEDEGSWREMDEEEPDDPWDGEQAPEDAHVSSDPESYTILRTHAERLTGAAKTLLEWSRQYNADSKGEASKDSYWALSKVIDTLIGPKNHNLLFGVLLGRPINSDSRPGEKFTRYLLEFSLDKLPQLNEDGSKVKTAKGRIVYNRNPRYSQKFVDAIFETWRQIDEDNAASPLTDLGQIDIPF